MYCTLQWFIVYRTGCSSFNNFFAQISAHYNFSFFLVFLLLFPHISLLWFTFPTSRFYFSVPHVSVYNHLFKFIVTFLSKTSFNTWFYVRHCIFIPRLLSGLFLLRPLRTRNTCYKRNGKNCKVNGVYNIEALFYYSKLMHTIIKS